MGLVDWTGQHSIRVSSHVKVVNKNSSRNGQTGTAVRIDTLIKKVWVAFPGGAVHGFASRSIEVMTPKSSR